MIFYGYKGSHLDPVLEVVDRLTEHRGGLLVVADPQFEDLSSVQPSLGILETYE